jgi:hypothetical protein
VATKYWLLMALTFSVCASAQRLNSGATCDPGTPIPFTDGTAWGYVTAAGVSIPPQFSSVMPFSSGVAAACKAEGCGLINTKGQFITPLREKGTANLGRRYSEGVGVIVKDDKDLAGKWGYVDLAGQIVIAPKFRYAGDFDHGMAVVNLNDKYFFINRKGDRITPEFDGAFEFSEGLAAVVIGGKVGYIRHDGTFALPPKYKGASGIGFSEGLVAFSSDGKVGFMDAKGSVRIEPAFDDAAPFSEGLAPVRLGENWGYIDNSGKLVIPARYRIAHIFQEGVASVQPADSTKWGYVDHAGAFRIPLVFDAAMPFCAGVARVQTFRNLGRERSAPVAQYFCRLEGKQGLIDHTGKYIWRDPVDRIWESAVCN